MTVVRALWLLLLAFAAGCSSPSGGGDRDGLGEGGGAGGRNGGGGGSGGAGGTQPIGCAEKPTGVPAPHGLDERPGNPTCVAPPRPASAAAVELRRVYPALRFDQPLLILQAPGDDSRWYVVEKPGRVLTFENREDVTTAEVFIDISDRVESRPKEAGLLGMAFHPNWPEVPEVFLSYTSGKGGFHSVVSRFRATTDRSALDPSSEALVLEHPQPREHHNGGHIAFGPDGMLYVGLGDGGEGIWLRDPTVLLGRILRIDPIGGSPYAIPPDNPFLGGPERPEVWATGFRNPWRWSFDRQTGQLWVADVGAADREEIDLVEPGRNYGWPAREGTRCNQAAYCAGTDFTDPIWEYGHEVGQSITGGFVYRGRDLPALFGVYVFGDFSSGRVWGLFTDDDGKHQAQLLYESGIALASFGESNAGELFATDIAGGGIYRLVPQGTVARPFPGKLSETGCVDPQDPRRPAPGLIPYDVNAPLWSDGAEKIRYFAIPDGTKITVLPDGDWELPIGSVIVKHFLFDCRLVETRLYVRHDDGDWAGYTYAWNEEQTDAFLLSDSFSTKIGERNWTFPSRAQCQQCHTRAAGRSLGLETAQLDGEIVWPNGRLANQIDTLYHIGILEEMPDRSRVLPAYSGEEHIELRAKAYLHGNCSSCHRPTGSGQGDADYRFATPLAEMGICDAVPQEQGIGPPDARILYPGDPSKSVIALRMRALDAFRMPQVGTAIVDEEGLAVVEEWIRWISRCP